MTLRVAERIATYADYLKTPEGASYQLIGGELIMSPSPELFHQDIVGNIFDRLREFVKKKRLGKVYVAPADVYFTRTETYQPDLIFVSHKRRHIIGKKKIHGAPDLVVEILSPGTAKYDLQHKKEVYESHGVQEYWIVHPKEKAVEVFSNSADGFALVQRARETGVVQSKLLVGFSVSIERIFEA
jgi:Uma2 family endonuclease